MGHAAVKASWDELRHLAMLRRIGPLILLPTEQQARTGDPRQHAAGIRPLDQRLDLRCKLRHAVPLEHIQDSVDQGAVLQSIRMHHALYPARGHRPDTLAARLLEQE